ncbi:hypothetical protein SASPL_152696 [Salvia splendens]|uniref:CRAL-TRIO domain-containing protein n=2 Tax=Salvia splendens TaxID=180675 RepID=A0A8X8W445_SALSN|nr:hypothetical protein SASPL_152696 [Salvia splendens]
MERKDDDGPADDPAADEAMVLDADVVDNLEEAGDEIEKGEPSSAGEEGEFPEDLKEYARKALVDLRSKVELAVWTNRLVKNSSKTNDTPKKHHHHHHHHHHNHHHHHKGKGKMQEKDEQGSDSEEAEGEGEGGDANAEATDVDINVSLWGVPLLPSKGDKTTDVLLLKFLRAKDFRAGEAFEMLRSCLEWRKKNKIDEIMHEDFGSEYDSVSYMKGLDRQGHPVCYNVYGVFADEEIYNRTFGNEGGRDRFLRWRLQLLEKEILKLDFSPGGISTLLQVNDLKDMPGPSRRDLRHATRDAVAVLQDNYPEFVSRNIFVNVPFWYYAFNAVLSPFLTQTTKNKFVFSRPSRVTETLVKYIAAEEIPIAYGGLLREEDLEFSTKDAASEIVIKPGATECIEIPAPTIGVTIVWDVAIVGWEVNYKEEFVPSDEKSYTLIVKKQRKISWQQEPMRNSFTNKEVGKLVITVENGMFKRKRVLYRYKIKNSESTSTSSS